MESPLSSCPRPRVISDQKRKAKAAKRGGGKIESLDALLESGEDRYRFEPKDPADPAKLFDQGRFSCNGRCAVAAWILLEFEVVP